MPRRSNESPKRHLRVVGRASREKGTLSAMDVTSNSVGACAGEWREPREEWR